MTAKSDNKIMCKKMFLPKSKSQEPCVLFVDFYIYFIFSVSYSDFNTKYKFIINERNKIGIFPIFIVCEKGNIYENLFC